MQLLAKLSTLLLLSIISIPIYAFDGITYYNTVISENDRYNSYGERLHSVRAILRQDRANMHKFGNSDQGDEYESYFSRTSKRNLFNRASLRISPSLSRSIKHGGRVHISVYVYSGEIEVTR